MTFAVVALGSTGVFATITLSPLVAVALTGAAALGGVPAAAVAAGSVLGATVLASVAARRGRAVALVTGNAAGAVGGGIGVLAVATDVVVPFLLAALLVGVANSAVLQARYAVADVFPAGRRTTVLAVVLWAGTIGAAVGPNTIDPAAGLANSVGAPALAGGMALVAVVFAVAAVVSLLSRVTGVAEPRGRRAPARVTGRTSSGADRRPSGAPRWPSGADRWPSGADRWPSGADRWPAGASQVGTPRPRVIAQALQRAARAGAVAWRSPVLAVAVTTMVIGQGILAAIQTVTPLHASDAGAGLDAVGVVMSSHVLGMYALVPVAGWLAERAGHLRVVVAGLVLLAGGAAASAVAPAGRAAPLAVALFVVGVGWSCQFVAASGLLTRAASFAERARTQGVVDTLVFASAGVASAVSGVLLATTSFAVLCLLGAALVVLPLAVIARNRAAL